MKNEMKINEQYEAEIERQVAVLMQPGYAFYPLTADNLSDALGDYATHAGNMLLLSTALQNNVPFFTGTCLKFIAVEYAKKQARAHVEKMLAAESREVMQ